MSKLLKRRSLHFRLLNVVAYALIIAIVISGLLILIIGRESAEQISEENYSVVGQILAEKTAFTLSLGSSYAFEAEETLSSARHLKDLSKVCLYNADGSLFSQYVSQNISESCYGSFVTNTNNSKLNNSHFGLGSRVSLPVVFNGERVGDLVIESTGSKLQGILSAMALAIFGSLLIALVIAFLFGSTQLRNALFGLRSLRETGVDVAQNPFASVRASKLQNDEVGDLVDAFNGMLDALEIENQKLRTSENTFRSLSENAPVGVFLRSSVNTYEFVNSTWTSMTGLNTESADIFSEYIGTDYKRHYIEQIASLQTTKNFVLCEFEFLHKGFDEFRYLQEYVSVFHEGDETYYIGTLIDVTELKRSQAELEKLAFYDPLTQLPNRRFLNDHLHYTFAAAQKKHTKLAVFITDLDNFKRINDTLGHDAGDQLLNDIGRRLQSAAFKEDVVSRMGGDEFLILVDGIENLNSIEFISKRLLNAMRTETSHELGAIPVSGSIGVAIYPDDSSSPEELLRHADLALYHSKENGGDQFSCYSDDLDKAIREQIRIEQKLRHAMKNNGIDVFLQPQVHSESGIFCWAEALVRWHDDEEGFISPTKFIPVAEDTGLIVELGKLVLEKVCEMLDKFNHELSQMNIEGVSVNLSAKQFYSGSLVSDIQLALKKYNISPELIEFELTESTVTDDMDKAISIMESIRALGCRLSMDDFGTGYSSLSYLTRFPMTSLKIDRSFVDKLPGSKHDEEIVSTIISLAHNLGMTVVAEGVETAEQAQYLAARNCEYQQGYYHGKPASITTLIAEHHTEKNQKRQGRPIG